MVYVQRANNAHTKYKEHFKRRWLHVLLWRNEFISQNCKHWVVCLSFLVCRKERHRQTNRQADRQTDRQTGRQTGRNRECICHEKIQRVKREKKENKTNNNKIKKKERKQH